VPRLEDKLEDMISIYRCCLWQRYVPKPVRLKPELFPVMKVIIMTLKEMHPRVDMFIV